MSAALKGFARLGVCAITTFQVALTSFSLYLLRVTWFITQSTTGTHTSPAWSVGHLRLCLARAVQEGSLPPRLLIDEPALEAQLLRIVLEAGPEVKETGNVVIAHTAAQILLRARVQAAPPEPQRPPHAAELELLSRARARVRVVIRVRLRLRLRLSGRRAGC